LFSFEQIRDTTAAAGAEALAFHLVVSLVVQVAETQRSNIQQVLVRLCGTDNHHIIQLRSNLA
ncbi:hypothetical protein ACDT17_21490, partial [Chromobacterium piscinae]|uniref:hypothetical protein n=1 Tax=Chromobacterium piscinae TaxID=686831 RepID=UPI003557AE6D